ncbi:MAG TPA: HAD-IIIC family phosphatase [Opitutus sp.]|nr:HAD-IIIC family phosphatase [Opitutus sp.]
MAAKKIKCVVWDLDHTVWNGILLEGDQLALRPGVREAIVAFDERGILQSIASRNESGPAREQLRRFGLEHFFLHPQIGWAAKSESIRCIAGQLNIGLDTFAFVDDQPFEREEVRFALPEVRTFDASEIARLVEDPDFTPRVVTEDARRRREMYQADATRQEAESSFKGPTDAFLATLEMEFSVGPAEAGDLVRVEELVARTNQLNTTGRIYAYEELAALRVSPDHLLLVAELTDKHGPYGKIGVVLLHRTVDTWTIKLLLMSCRVMSRGVGGALITLLRQQAREAGVRLLAEFKPTDRNRMMYITYKFSGFSEVSEVEGTALLEADPASIPELPAYFRINASWQGGVRG